MADTARPHATEGLTPSACHDARTSTQAGCHDAPHIFADGDPHRAASSAGIAGPGRGSALYYSVSMTGHGTWALVGSWSLTAIAILFAMVGGILAGLLDASQQTVERLEQQLRTWLHTLPCRRKGRRSDRPPLDSVRAEYETLVEQWATRTGERLRLPRWLKR